MNKNKISAKIVADSINTKGDRITTFLLTYPRFIHGEVMTHRLFSRNSASSRAIPFEKMVKMVEEDPFIPIAWQKDHKGMQGGEYITDRDEILSCKDVWTSAKDEAVWHAKTLNRSLKVTKQLCNRLLEPFMWHTVLVTATEWDNFFELRCPQYGGTDAKNNEVYFKSKKEAIKHLQEIGVNTVNLKEDDILGWLQINKSQAEIHIQALAEVMWDAMNESVPKQLKAGEWHVPFGEEMDDDIIYNKFLKPCNFDYNQGRINLFKIAIATARCARLSYITFDGEIDYEKDIKLHDKLLKDRHASPFEHCARAMNEEEYDSFIKGKVELGLDTSTGGWGGPPNTTYHPGENVKGWCNNFKGFVQYRYIVENNIKI